MRLNKKRTAIELNLLQLRMRAQEVKARLLLCVICATQKSQIFFLFKIHNATQSTKKNDSGLTRSESGTCSTPAVSACTSCSNLARSLTAKTGADTTQSDTKNCIPDYNGAIDDDAEEHKTHKHNMEDNIQFESHHLSSPSAVFSYCFFLSACCASSSEKCCRAARKSLICRAPNAPRTHNQDNEEPQNKRKREKQK